MKTARLIITIIIGLLALIVVYNSIESKSQHSTLLALLVLVFFRAILTDVHQLRKDEGSSE